jgi:ABC-type nitrate/sulfonate/bicarbonate transport system permease component
MIRLVQEAARRLGGWAAGLLPLASLLTAWQLLGDDGSAFFPRPLRWVEAVTGLGWSEVLTAVVDTLTRFAGGLALAFVIGSLLGLVIGRLPLVDAAVSPTLEFLRATPAPAVVPMVVLIAGSGTTTLLIAVTLAALWPILLNTAASARSLEPLLGDVAETLHLSAWKRTMSITVPAVVPGAFVGARVALPIALVVTLLAEMLTGSGGLGGSLLTAQRTYATATAYGLLVVAGVLGVLLAFVFGVLESRVTRAWSHGRRA